MGFEKMTLFHGTCKREKSLAGWFIDDFDQASVYAVDDCRGHGSPRVFIVDAYWYNRHSLTEDELMELERVEGRSSERTFFERLFQKYDCISFPDRSVGTDFILRSDVLNNSKVLCVVPVKS